MTLKQWLNIERLPEYSGINARATLRRMCVERPFRVKLFNLAINTRDIPLKRILFRMARTY